MDNFMAAFGIAKYTENRDQTIVFPGVLADGTPNTKAVYVGQGMDLMASITAMVIIALFIEVLLKTLFRMPVGEITNYKCLL